MTAHVEWLYAPECALNIHPGTDEVNGEEVCELPGTIGLALAADEIVMLTGTPAEVISLLQRAIVAVIKYDIAHPELHQ